MSQNRFIDIDGLTGYIIPIIRGKIILAATYSGNFAFKSFFKRINIAGIEKIGTIKLGQSVGGNIAHEHIEIIAHSLKQSYREPFMIRRKYKKSSVGKNLVQLFAFYKTGKNNSRIGCHTFKFGGIWIGVIGISGYDKLDIIVIHT